MSFKDLTTILRVFIVELRSKYTTVFIYCQPIDWSFPVIHNVKALEMLPLSRKKPIDSFRHNVTFCRLAHHVSLSYLCAWDKSAPPGADIRKNLCLGVCMKYSSVVKIGHR